MLALLFLLRLKDPIQRLILIVVNNRFCYTTYHKLLAYYLTINLKTPREYTMKITDKTVVQFHYTLKDEAGEELESSFGSDPLAYLHGQKNMLVGVENALTGKEKGEKFTVTLQPEDACGEYQKGAVQRIPAKHLQDGAGTTKWKAGMVASVQTEQGQRQVTVMK